MSKEPNLNIRKDIWQEYRSKFLSFVPDAKSVYWASRILKRIEANKDKYCKVACAAKVPYLVVGVIHYLEANNDFTCSIRDGSKLRKGKDWVEDAIEVMKQYSCDKWDISRALYVLEKHNGFGYRQKGINSPYLWAGTNLYKKGKYVKDGVFDPEAVSKQVGGALILRMDYLSNLKDLEDADKALEKVVRIC